MNDDTPTRRVESDDTPTRRETPDDHPTVRGLVASRKVFGRYTLIRMLGQGGMGVVWLARDQELEREIALKFLPEAVAMDPQSVSELKRETKRSLELTHPNIIRIHDFVQDGQTAAISMEYVDGKTLAALKLDQPNQSFTPQQLAPWVCQLCTALDYAHNAAQVVHRDLKPANLMVDAKGDLKIADFGIAASVSDSVSRVSLRADSAGTPSYMSPQQMMGERPATTDDIYSLGATLYDLLTSRPPFYSGNVTAQVQTKIPAKITARRQEFGFEDAALNKPFVDAAWEQTILACLAKEPRDRPKSAVEVAERLGYQIRSAVPGVSPLVAGRAADLAAAGVLAKGTSAPPILAQSGGRKSRAMLPLALVLAGLLLAGIAYRFGVPRPRQEPPTLPAEGGGRAGESQVIPPVAPRGSLAITTVPPGAEVAVGGFALERSPVTLKDVAPGQYTVVVRLPGYEELRLESDVKGNETARIDVPLVRSTGVAEITSSPQGLDVDVASPTGEYPNQTVKTPARLEGLPTGTYELTFHREGWPEQQRTVAVQRNQTVSALAEFIGGNLAVTSRPSGAEVWSHGKLLGVTPLTLQGVAPGRFDLNVRLDGYQTQRKEGVVGARATAQVFANLQKVRIAEDLQTRLQPPPSPGSVYIVKPGDTPEGISEATGVPLDKLQNANPGLEWSSLTVGQTIRVIPGAARPLPRPHIASAYVVRAGDTPNKISKATGVSLDELQRANPGLVWWRLKVGQRINVPGR
jgi:LysM repeat protein